MKNFYYLLIGIISLTGCRSNEKVAENSEVTAGYYREPHRPQFHFSPKEKWMNDPNGMVFHNGEYHLFYQFYPDGLTWGPMHWGHAISKDLMHWEHLPIALYPDKNGLIFSGSAVVDYNNTSGLGSPENPPLVAIFTYHSLEREKAGATDYQTQGIAFSTDDGRTWKMFEGNPVIPNQGVRDFRDPKVFWHEQTAKWIMILAAQDHVELWNSPDLKNWSKLSDFGTTYGAHGGVWECPDLFQLTIEGETKEKWVMLVSINPGGPNGGSATQYFTGDFDGKVFTPDSDPSTTKWLDYGPDNYAGVTWFNAPDDRKIFLGWMSNWAYAEAVPTFPWRSAMTLPRDLRLVRAGKELRVKSTLSPELAKIAGNPTVMGLKSVNGTLMLNADTVAGLSKVLIKGSAEVKDFSIEFSNEKGQTLLIGFRAQANQYFIDRGRSGKNDFSENFNSEIIAPRLSTADKITFSIVADVSSVEIFFDDGLTVMTSLFFPDEELTKIVLKAPQEVVVDNLEITPLKSIW